MEEINSENKMDCENVELSKYQLYCDRVNLYNKKAKEFNENCESL